MPDDSEPELERVRRRLKELVERRRLVGFDAQTQAEYDDLSRRERELLARQEADGEGAPQ